MALHPYMRTGKLNGLISDLVSAANPLQSSVDASCDVLTRQRLAAVDADIRDVEDNWRPTGFYTPDQLSTIIQFGIRVQNRAAEAIEAGLGALQLEQHSDILKKAGADLFGDLVNSDPFVKAVQDARARGIKVIESRGFRRWVINILKVARNANFAATLVDCARPGVLFSALSALGAASDALVKLVKTVGEIVVAAGELVLKIPDALGALVTVIKVIPWILLLGAGYYVAVKTDLVPHKYDPLKLRERETWKPWQKKGA